MKGWEEKEGRKIWIVGKIKKGIKWMSVRKHEWMKDG